jgi:hypothetical protein
MGWWRQRARILRHARFHKAGRFGA